MYVCTYIYIYTLMCIYIYTYIYIYMYTHTNVGHYGHAYFRAYIRQAARQSVGPSCSAVRRRDGSCFVGNAADSRDIR